MTGRLNSQGGYFNGFLHFKKPDDGLLMAKMINTLE